MISRHWKGRTRPGQDEAYIRHLKTETFPRIEGIPGFVSASILRRAAPDGSDFEIVTVWESLEAIRAFAGHDVEAAVVPDVARAMLSSFDDRVVHYEIVHRIGRS